MKIAIIARRLNVRGGTQRMIAHLAHTLRNMGHVVTLYTFFYERNVCYPELLGDFTVVKASAEDVRRLQETSSRKGIASFFRNYMNENRAARNLARKIPEDIDVLNPHDQLAYRVAHYYKKDKRDIPSVWMLNDMSTKRAMLRRNREFDVNLRPPLLKRMAYWLIDAYEYHTFIQDQDRIAVLDTRDKRWADEEFPRSTTVVVRNGLDIHEFPYRQRDGIVGKKIRLLAIAILLPHRRFEDAIEAVEILRKRGYDADLTIAGDAADTNYYRTLSALVERLGLTDHVRFVGHAGREELLSLYGRSDIFVFPCHLQSWGLVVFEAMATGLPVIVSETAGASEVLHDGDTALIVPPYDPERVAAAAQKLAEDSPFYCRMSAAGRKFVEESISWERYTNALLELFQKAGERYR